MRRFFPNLQEGVSLEFTSPVDYNYNCLAWALGCNAKPFEKAKGALWEWPDIPDDTADGWALVCEVHGFSRTETSEFRPGYEKIAILEDDEGQLHATRNDENGRWKSKLGDQGPDIDHVGLGALQGAYGDVAIVLERHRPDWEKK